VVRATRVGRDTALARIVDLVRRAQGSKSPLQRLADRISEWFVPAVLVVAVATFAVWLAFGPEPQLTLALTAFIGVVIIACPCAMGLATPTAIMVATGRGAEAGILVRNGEALEAAGRVDTVVFDKTGTLTLGKPAVTATLPVEGVSDEELLDIAASLERGSEHPLGAAIVAAAADRGLGGRAIDAFEAVPGHGVRGTVDGVAASVGSPRLVPVDVPGPIRDAADALAADGATVSWVASAGRLLGAIAIADPVRPEAAEAIRLLRAQGLRVRMLTGDARATAEAVGRRLGLSPADITADVLPEGKVAAIEALRGQGRRVAMVGDGINDAPALVAADLGIAIGTGADVAIEAAGVTLVAADPRLVASAVTLARRTVRTIRQNLFWAFAYNVVLIPVAAGILFPTFGILLSPALAAGAMALSSVSVVTNSLRLRRVDVRPEHVRPVRSGTLAAVRDGAFLAGVASIALATAGGGVAADRAIDASAVRLDVVAHDVAYAPMELHTRAGAWTVVTFRNDDPMLHDWEVEGVANVDAGARPGQTTRLRFIIDEPGRYAIRCTVAGHAAAGMVGTLVVAP
jgi:Cu+-exporting ATPase